MYVVSMLRVNSPVSYYPYHLLYHFSDGGPWCPVKDDHDQKHKMSWVLN